MPSRTASRIARFSATSHGSVASSFTLIGPPITTRRSMPSSAGIASPEKKRVYVIVAPRASSQGRMHPMSSKATCWKT